MASGFISAIYETMEKRAGASTALVGGGKTALHGVQSAAKKVVNLAIDHPIYTGLGIGGTYMAGKGIYHGVKKVKRGATGEDRYIDIPQETASYGVY
jgi:hypothetical protein